MKYALISIIAITILYVVTFVLVMLTVKPESIERLAIIIALGWMLTVSAITLSINIVNKYKEK